MIAQLTNREYLDITEALHRLGTLLGQNPMEHVKAERLLELKDKLNNMFTEQVKDGKDN